MQSKDHLLTPNIFTRTLKILHLAFTFSPLFFLLFVLYTMDEWKLNLDNYSDPFLFVVPITAIGGVFLSKFLYKRNIDALKDKDNLRSKLAGFQSASIVSYAPVEGAALLGIVAAYKSPNIFYLSIAGLLIIYLFYQRPSKLKIEQDLELHGELKNQFDKGDEEIH
jgi:hypothetical protein